jgi:uncharacterized protein
MVKTDSTMIEVEIAYALQDHQLLIAVTVPQGATVLEAIKQSQILHHFPDIDLNKQKVGIFSRFCQLDQIVHAGDRIEIYRPLSIDPKDARRARGKKH